ncbi:MAG: LytR/AlgR family response regulator transcription factor [Terrimicrobiaceae bacterium]
MKILIMDDEPPARRGLREALHKLGVTDVREASSVAKALESINEDRPDLLMLDIEMPRAGGFQLIETLPAQGIPVIFVTAHSEHAARAFDVRAVDYLLKPVNPQRLVESLKRVEKNEEPKPFSADDRVLFRDGSTNHFVRIGDIRVLESSGAYTRIIQPAGNITITGTLTSVMERLDPAVFFRASRAQGANLLHVSKVDEGINGNMLLHLDGGMKVEVSRRQSVEFRKLRAI